MTSRRASSIRLAFDKTFQTQSLLARFHREGAAERALRKVDPRALVLALTLGGLEGVTRSLESMRRAYERLASQTLARSSFHARLNDGLAEVLRGLVDEALRRAQARTAASRLRIEALRGIVIADSTIVRLHPALAAEFPGAWANHSPAALKLTVVHDLQKRRPERIKLAAGSTHDLHQLDVDAWYRGRLLLADRAFTACWKLQEIEARGGFYVGRIRANVSPVLEEVRRGFAPSAIGRRLFEALPEATGDVLDAQVAFGFRRRLNGKWISGVHRCRLVGERHGGRYRVWITNLPEASASPGEVARLYGARWEVEIFFRELKSVWRANQIPTSKKGAALCLLYASMLAVLLSREMRDRLLPPALRAHAKSERWARVLRSIVMELGGLFVDEAPYADCILAQRAEWLCAGARDPNHRRRAPIALQFQRLEGHHA